MLPSSELFWHSQRKMQPAHLCIPYHSPFSNRFLCFSSCWCGIQFLHFFYDAENFFIICTWDILQITSLLCNIHSIVNRTIFSESFHSCVHPDIAHAGLKKPAENLGCHRKSFTPPSEIASRRSCFAVRSTLLSTKRVPLLPLESRNVPVGSI